MNVNINETWNYQSVMQFNDGSAASGKIGGNGNNTPLGNGNIQRLKASVEKDSSSGQQQMHRCSPLGFFRKDMIPENRGFVNQP